MGPQGCFLGLAEGRVRHGWRHGWWDLLTAGCGAGSRGGLEAGLGLWVASGLFLQGDVERAGSGVRGSG